MCLVSYCFSFSFSTASLHVFVHLFWRANQLSSKNLKSESRRFVSCLGHLRYFMGLSCKVECFHGRTLPVLPARICPLREGRWQNGRQKRRPWRPLLFLLRRFWELTKICFEIFFSSSDSFRSLFSTENIHRSKLLQLFYNFLVRC